MEQTVRIGNVCSLKPNLKTEQSDCKEIQNRGKAIVGLAQINSGVNVGEGDFNGCL